MCGNKKKREMNKRKKMDYDLFVNLMLVLIDLDNFGDKSIDVLADDFTEDVECAAKKIESVILDSFEVVYNRDWIQDWFASGIRNIKDGVESIEDFYDSLYKGICVMDDKDYKISECGKEQTC